MDRADLPPRPHLFGHEREHRRHEAQEHRKRGSQSRTGRSGTRIVGLAVGADLDQFQVVVAERPEEGFGALEGPGVVVGLECGGGLGDDDGQPAEHGLVDGEGDGLDRRDHESSVFTGQPAEGESRGVQHLHGETPTDLHLPFVDSGVGAGPAAGRPVPDGIRPVLLEQGQGGDDVPLRLGHLLSIRIEHPARDGCVRPRQGAVLELGAHHSREQPGPDDVVALGPQIHGEDPSEQIRVVLPSAGDLRGERRCGPGVHDVRITDEAPRLAALVGSKAVGDVGRRVDRQQCLVRQDRCVVDDLTFGVHRVPDRQGNAEEPLTADVPVSVEPLDPRLEAMSHVGRVPLELLASGQQRLAVGHRLDEPLPGRDDLQRTIALLEELHRMGDRPRVADHGARFDQDLHDAGLGLLDRTPHEFGVVGIGIEGSV